MYVPVLRERERERETRAIALAPAELTVFARVNPACLGIRNSSFLSTMYPPHSFSFVAYEVSRRALFTYTMNKRLLLIGAVAAIVAPTAVAQADCEPLCVSQMDRNTGDTIVNANSEYRGGDTMKIVVNHEQCTGRASEATVWLTLVQDDAVICGG